MIVIAIVGMAGSGKSSVCSYLASKSFPVVTFGDIIQEEVAKRGLLVNEDSERTVREELRDRFGMGFCAERSVQIIQMMAETDHVVIIDGLYSYTEYEILLQHFGTALNVVAIFVPKLLRYRRLSQRQIRPLSQQEAEQRDVAEIRFLEKAGPIALADYTIVNDGDQELLRNHVDQLVDELISSDDRSQRDYTSTMID